LKNFTPLTLGHDGHRQLSNYTSVRWPENNLRKINSKSFLWCKINSREQTDIAENIFSMKSGETKSMQITLSLDLVYKTTAQEIQSIVFLFFFKKKKGFNIKI